jgi:tRNA (guanosine-2'-O-)-methyltransferase
LRATHGNVRRESEGVIDSSAAQWDDVAWTRGWSTEGLIAVLEPLVMEPRRVRILQLVAGRTDNVTVAMDAPHDPHNGAAVMRTCDAFGVQQLNVVEALEPFLLARKVSLGTERWVEVHRHGTYAAAIARLQSTGYTLVAACMNGELVPSDLAIIPRFALVMGNERAGVSNEFLAAAQLRVKIPMRGFVESLNLSVATAILLHAALGNRAGDLPESRQRELYARGLVHSVVKVRQVLASLEAR